MNKQISVLFQDVINEEQGNTSLIKDESYFSSQYLPEVFPHRSNQLRELIRYFHGFFSVSNEAYGPQFGQTILIHGAVGSGKTSVVKRFGLEFENIAREKYPYLNVKYRHINCRRNRTVYSVLVRILQSLIPYFPNRGFSPAELLRLLETHLQETDTFLLLSLDEIDVLSVRDPEFLSFMYSLTRLNDELLAPGDGVGQRMSLILISRDRSAFNLADSATRSSLPKNFVKFPKYTKEQLTDILHDRSGGLKPGVISDEIVQQIAEYASTTGDARYAIEMLLKTAKKANMDGEESILLEHIEMIQDKVNSISSDRFNDLEISHKIFLLTVAKWLKENENQDSVTMNEIKKYLPMHAERIGVRVGKGNTSLWLYMKTLASLDIIATNVISSGRMGRTTLISLEMNPDLIIGKLENLLKMHVETKKAKRK